MLMFIVSDIAYYEQTKDELMKKLEFKFTGGDTPVVFVSFYNEDFKDKLDAEDADFFEQMDFLSKHQAKSIWLGRGMCREGDPTVKVF